MLDWQLLHQGCPAYDLAYFLTGSFREVQIEEFGDRLLKAYLLSSESGPPICADGFLARPRAGTEPTSAILPVAEAELQRTGQ